MVVHQGLAPTFCRGLQISSTASLDVLTTLQMPRILIPYKVYRLSMDPAEACLRTTSPVTSICKANYLYLNAQQIIPGADHAGPYRIRIRLIQEVS